MLFYLPLESLVQKSPKALQLLHCYFLKTDLSHCFIDSSSVTNGAGRLFCAQLGAFAYFHHNRLHLLEYSRHFHPALVHSSNMNLQCITSFFLHTDRFLVRLRFFHSVLQMMSRMRYQIHATDVKI
ncbi:hypothetical protein L596_000302 [Steinernema carpocapsae]|uniref:Uncharacterized protein n=1 Tax=Steinernema carpocapsae TaxID=34508 RepID=A0A4U8UHR3_STECR|nr:hypothetical protein L596_000302 [Steinernema carpocapsae]